MFKYKIKKKCIQIKDNNNFIDYNNFVKLKMVKLKNSL